MQWCTRPLFPTSLSAGLRGDCGIEGQSQDTTEKAVKVHAHGRAQTVFRHDEVHHKLFGAFSGCLIKHEAVPVTFHHDCYKVIATRFQLLLSGLQRIVTIFIHKYMFCIFSGRWTILTWSKNFVRLEHMVLILGCNSTIDHLMAEPHRV